jgi:hypothetical protein
MHSVCVVESLVTVTYINVKVCHPTDHIESGEDSMLLRRTTGKSRNKRNIEFSLYAVLS